MRKLIILLIVCLLSVLVFVGCAKVDDKAGGDESNKSATVSDESSGSQNKFDVFTANEDFNVAKVDGEIVGFLDFDYVEGVKVPDDFPKFTKGKEIDVDMKDFPDANWAKGYEKVSRKQINDFANKCHELGFRVGGFDSMSDDSEETDSIVIGISHSTKGQSLTTVYDYNTETYYIASYNNE